MGQDRLPAILQLKIVLVDSEPEIWRRVLIPAGLSLSALHDIIQRAMGWQGLADYEFRLGLGREAVVYQPAQNLADLLAKAAEKGFYYNYDVASSGWLHRLEVDALADDLASAASDGLPKCLDGAMACPPEGTGGVWGYDDFLDRLEDVNDPDYLDLIEKYGDFDPTAFTVEAVNARFQM
jgi:hypothetical protein